MTLIKKLIKYIFSIYLRLKTKSLIMSNCNLNSNTKLEGFNVVHKNTDISACSIGFGTYIGENSKLMKTVIGRYCSISNNVSIIIGRHPTKDFVSTHPSFFSILMQSGFTYVDSNKYKEVYYVDNENKYVCRIGSDVWIGANVSIFDGCTIGDGAIIAAGAVVTKDVEPYSIYGGVPAKMIRKRFSDEEIEQLTKIRWWEYPQNWIEQNAYLFTDIKRFLNAVSIGNEGENT